MNGRPERTRAEECREAVARLAVAARRAAEVLEGCAPLGERSRRDLADTRDVVARLAGRWPVPEPAAPPPELFT